MTSSPSEYQDHVLGTLCNGEIEFVLYNDSYYTQLQDAISNVFLRTECLSIATQTSAPTAESSRVEFMWLVRESLKDGVSVIARDASSGRLVGHVVNKVQVLDNNNDNNKDDAELSFNEHFVRNVCRSVESCEMMRFLGDLERQVDLYALHKVDTMLEITFLGVAPEYRRRSIARKLVEHSLQVARDVRSGRARHLLPAALQPYGDRLRVATAIFASAHSQRIGDALGFRVHHEAFYDQAVFAGRTYAERLADKAQRSATLVSVEI